MKNNIHSTRSTRFATLLLCSVSLSLILPLSESLAAVLYEEKAFLPAHTCYGVDLSPDESILYVPTHFGDWLDGVSLYHPQTYTLDKVFQKLPDVPKCILASADPQYFYATAYYGRSVVKLRASDGGTVGSILVGSWPVGMVFDSIRRYLYVMVGCPYPGAVGHISIIDTSTDTVVGTIGPIVHAGTVLAISPDDQFLCALSYDYAGSEPQTLYKMTIADRSVQSVPGVRVGGISISPDGQLLYVGDRFAGAVRVFQTSSMTETTSIPIADVHSFWVAPSGDHGLAVCLSPESGELLIRVVGLPGGEILQTLSHTLELPDAASSFPLVDPALWRLTTGELLIPIFRVHGGVLVLSPIPSPLIDVTPDTLNLKSHGQYLTCYITMPEGYSVNDIDTSTVAITNINGDDVDLPIDPSFTPQIGDRDEDGIPDLTVKFDRQALIALPLLIGDRSIAVEFDLISGRHLEGSDTIRVIDRGK